MKGRNKKPHHIPRVLLVATCQIIAQSSLRAQEQPTTLRPSTWTRQTVEQVTDKSPCIATKIDTSWATDTQPLEIGEHRFQMTAQGTSFVDLVISNPQSAPIEAAALVIEYLSDHDLRMEAVPLMAATERSATRFRPPFPLERVAASWKAPLITGESARVQGLSNGVIAAECPARARITFASVQYTNGDTVNYASPGWQVPPTPRVIPFASQFSSDTLKQPIALLGRIKISASGHVEDVMPIDHSHMDIFNEIRDQMKADWKFNPGLSDGKPRPSEIFALFRLQPDQTPTLRGGNGPGTPVTLIQFFPDQSNPGKLEIAFGNLLSGSAVE